MKFLILTHLYHAFLFNQNFFLMLILSYIFLRVWGADNKVSSKALLLRKTGRVNSEVLLVRIGTSVSSVRLN